jgi:Tfp pilus assembly protein PilN
MKETLEIIYDIFAGMGMFVTILICIAFIYGLLVSKKAKLQNQRETEALLAKLNPEMKKVHLKKLMAELEQEAKDLVEGGKEDDKSKSEGS